MDAKKMTTLVKIGPYGSSTGLGKAWDDKGRAKIARIMITYESNNICSLQFLYVEDGNLVLSELHGKHIGSTFNMVTLDHESEYIKGLTGTYCTSNYVGYSYYVKSLTIETNVKTIGPFGVKDSPSGYKFSIQLGPGNHFGGFHGNFFDSRLLSIGLYVDPAKGLLTSHLSPKV